MNGMTHVDRIAILADRSSCACVADVPSLLAAIKEQKEKEAADAEKARRAAGGGTPVSAMSGIYRSSCGL